MFTAHEDDDESNCDLTMDFSPDNSRDWGHLTSTPIKLDDTSTLVSDASSPLSFLSPNFSFVDNSVDVQSSHKSITEATGTLSSSNLTSQPQSQLQSRQISHDFGQPQANASTSSHPHQISTVSSQSESNTNISSQPDQISATPCPTKAASSQSNQISADSATNQTTSGLPRARGITLVGDNVDKTVKTRYMRADQQGKSLHYFHAYAVQDRFDLTMPEEALSIPDNPDLDTLLPSDWDESTMKRFFAIHVARILCKYMPFFSEDFGDVIPKHLDHPLSSEMSQKSKVVSNKIITLSYMHVCVQVYTYSTSLHNMIC